VKIHHEKGERKRGIIMLEGGGGRACFVFGKKERGVLVSANYERERLLRAESRKGKKGEDSFLDDCCARPRGRDAQDSATENSMQKE